MVVITGASPVEGSYGKDDLRGLYDGLLPWHKTFEIMSKPKDGDRFDKYGRRIR